MLLSNLDPVFFPLLSAPSPLLERKGFRQLQDPSPRILGKDEIRKTANTLYMLGACMSLKERG